MVSDARTLANHGNASRLEETKWWFLPGFVFDNIGLVGASLTVAGMGFVTLTAVRGDPDHGDRRRQAAIVVAVLNSHGGRFDGVFPARSQVDGLLSVLVHRDGFGSRRDREDGGPIGNGGWKRSLNGLATQSRGAE